MKLKVYDGNKTVYLEVGFWSFMKCYFLVNLALMGMIYGGMIILFIIFGVF